MCRLGNYVLGNLGPDEPFGGGIPDVDFDVADPDTTGQIMEFSVVPALAPDPTTPPQFLQLPPLCRCLPETVTRPLALIEKMGMVDAMHGMDPLRPCWALLIRDGHGSAQDVDGSCHRKPGCGRILKSGSSTTSPPMRIPCTSMRSSSKWLSNREGLVLRIWTAISCQPVQLDAHRHMPEAWEIGFKDTVTAYPGRSPACAHNSIHQVSSSGTATSSHMKTTR